MDPERLEHLARSVCARWWGPEREDLLQEARMAVWQHRGLPDGLAVWAARCDVIDRWRRATGHRSAQPTPVLCESPPERVTVDHQDLVLEWGLTGRDAVIVAMLAAGATKQNVAARLGVHPSRVSQLIAGLRAQLYPAAS